jgi:hypothetical protein
MEQSKESETSRPTAFATMIAILSVVVLIVLIFVGSRGLRDFDSALIGYAVATVFAVAALAFRYTLWIGRPPTWRYFRAGWTNFLSLRNFRRYSFLIPKAWWTDIFAQTFIRKRGTLRWVAHMCIFWGVILSLLITLPLTFGWLHFTLIPPYHYRVWFFGLPLFILYHGLDFTAALLIIGVTIALWRRISDAGLLAIQRFGSISCHWFLSLTHEVIVVVWLLSIPFGKFFHIIERPASIGVTLYQTVNQDVEHYGKKPQTGRCKRCGQELPSEQFVQDLKGVLNDLGQNYELGDDRGVLQEYCPTCKRILRGEAYYQLMGKRFL